MATAVKPSRQGNGARLRPPHVPRRQGRWVVIGVLLIAGSALAGAVWARAVNQREPVLAAAKLVPAGQVLGDDDLKVVRVAGDSGMRFLAADRRDTVVGETAAVDLVPDTLLTRRHVGDNAGLSPGKAVVGVALKPGQMPAAKVAPGNQVEVVDTGAAAGAMAASRPTVLAAARVVGVEEAESDAGQTLVVSVLVERREAPAVAAAGASGRASLVLVS